MAFAREASMTALYSRYAPPLLSVAAFGIVLLAAGCAQISMVVPLGLGGGDDAPTGAVAAATPPDDAAPVRRTPRIDDVDWTVARGALYTALAEPRGKSVPWINPETGVMGTVALEDEGPATCRPFDLTVFDKDRADRLSGEACRGPAGDWTLSQLRPFDGLR